MSVKWKTIGTNALEEYNAKCTTFDFKEKKSFYQKKRQNSFKWGMKNNRMQVNKPKKVYNDDAGTD